LTTRYIDMEIMKGIGVLTKGCIIMRLLLAS